LFDVLFVVERYLHLLHRAVALLLIRWLFVEAFGNVRYVDERVFDFFFLFSLTPGGPSCCFRPCSRILGPGERAWAVRPLPCILAPALRRAGCARLGEAQPRAKRHGSVSAAETRKNQTAQVVVGDFVVPIQLDVLEAKGGGKGGTGKSEHSRAGVEINGDFKKEEENRTQDEQASHLPCQAPKATVEETITFGLQIEGPLD